MQERPQEGRALGDAQEVTEKNQQCPAQPGIFLSVPHNSRNGYQSNHHPD
jgi:hypothetical protein